VGNYLGPQFSGHMVSSEACINTNLERIAPLVTVDHLLYVEYCATYSLLNTTR